MLAQPGARVLDLDDDGVVQQAAQEGGRNDGLADTSASGMRATLTSPADVKLRCWEELAASDPSALDILQRSAPITDHHG